MKTLVQNSGLIALAAFTALAITAVGQGLWGVMAMVNVALTPAIPWAAPVMALVLACLVLFLTGRAGPAWGAARRHAMVPLARVSGKVWLWSLIGGGAGVIALAALWTVMASIVRVPPNLLPDTRGIPLWTGVPLLLVAIAAAPLTEEIAFRGYAMSLLRRRFGPTAALVIASTLFACAHLTQGLSAPKLIVYELVGLGLGFVALRAGSLLPAMVVHSFGDFVFFTTVWSHDAGRRLISEGGADGWFFANVAMLVVFTLVCAFGLRQLVRVTSDRPNAGRGAPAGALAAA
jgi:membrane protease YdiL (CAAX protease family)